MKIVIGIMAVSLIGISIAFGLVVDRSSQKPIQILARTQYITRYCPVAELPMKTHTADAVVFGGASQTDTSTNDD